MLRDYFRGELQDYAARLAGLVREDDAMAQLGELLRLARALRGTAHLAGEDALFDVAALLERAARALVAGDISWSTDTHERIERTLVDIEVVLAGSEDAEALQRRVGQTAERWQAIGVGEAPEAAEERPSTGLDDEAFLSFAAAEIDGIVTVLGETIERLGAEPMDRDALRAVLLRQRALLGTARLDDLPAVAETLHAIEDVSGIIAKMGIGIKDEWLEVYRCARTVLEASAGSLARGEDTPHTPALSRLRTYRQELVERYGMPDDGTALLDPGLPRPEEPETPDEVAADPWPADRGPVEPEPAPQPEPEPADTLDIQNLMYTGDAALRRALGLRARLEQAVEHDPDALALVDEVFDLIRLGLR